MNKLMPLVTDSGVGINTLAPADIPRKVWTREEAHALVDLGFPNTERWELINGELIDKMGKNRLHVIWQGKLHAWLIGVFGNNRVESEAPSDVANEDNAHNEPEADLKVLKRASQEYASNPQPEDILLIIEIADSTLRFDLGPKAKLYARAAIMEYWVLDIPGRRLVVHQEPEGGRYRSVIIYDAHEEVAPLAAPEAQFCLDRL